MKKNKMMRLASAMMVLTLMSTSVISGTFAKYVTSDSATDTARVAKWGVTVLASGSLFGEHYFSNSESNNAIKNTISAIAKGSVDVTTAGTDIVAPGTQSDKGLVLSIAGTPEVAYEVTMAEATATNSDIKLKAGDYGVMVEARAYVTAANMAEYYIADGTTYVTPTAYDEDATYYEYQELGTVETNNGDGFYYPLMWTVTGAAAGSYRTVGAMHTALKDVFDSLDGLALAPLNTNSVITWTWEFTGIEQSDVGDTVLGNLQALTSTSNYKVVKVDGTTISDVVADDYSLTVGFEAEITATQGN